MATFQASLASDTSLLNEIYALKFGSPDVGSTNAGQAVFDWSPTTGFDAGKHVVLTLTGSNMNDANPANWAITGITATVNGSTDWQISGISLAGDVLEQAVNNFNPSHLLFDGADTINGSAQNDVLFGYNNNDVIHGGAGNDKLGGSKGFDTLVGGPGHDTFIFSEPLDGTNVDTIADFNPSQDHIELAYQIYGNTAGFGVLPAAEFHIGPHATTAAQRIIYNANTGALYYDANGSHPGGQELVAHLHAHLAMTASDFLVV